MTADLSTDSKAARRGVPLIDGIEKVTPFVVVACKSEPKASFWGKIDAEMKKVF